MSQETMEFCRNEIEDLLSKGIIHKSKSPWSCSAFYVQKNAELERGAPRLVINRLNGSIIFSKFDMKSGFWQIQIYEKDKYKIAFVTHPWGNMNGT
jgi:hypothetical protein